LQKRAFGRTHPFYNGLVVLVVVGILTTGFSWVPAGFRTTEAAQRRPVTFTRDVAPVLYENCVTCHRPGESAPFSLLTYDDARQRARLIATSTEHRVMPPWQPAPDVGEFEGARRLTDAEIDVLQRWVEDGTLEGEPDDLPPPPNFTPGWQLGPPDLIVTLPEAFEMPAAGPDLFRNFVFPLALKSRRYVQAVEFRPGNPRVVHHARIMLDETREPRRRDAEDPMPGFAGMDAPGARFPDGHFLGWAAGKLPAREALSWPLEPNTDIVVQLHLKPSGRIESVRPSIGFYFTSKPPSASPVMLRLGSRTIDIPPDATDYLVTDAYELPVDVDALRIYPHAHYLARDMTIQATLPGGQVKGLLHIADWNFNWQDDYEYARPVSLPKGTKLEMRYTYDNSSANPHNPHSPPRRVRFGPQANDEMAELLVQLLPRKDSDLALLRADVARKTLSTEIAGEEKQLAEHPDDPETRNSLGVHYVQVGRVADAVTQFRAALDAVPEHAVANYNLGLIAINSRQFELARRHLEQAIATRPDYVEAHTNLGALLEMTGRKKDAIAHYRRALQIRSDHAIAANNLGRALIRDEAWDAAVDVFQAATRARPDDPTLLDGLAVAYAGSGRFEAAARTAATALARALDLKNDALAAIIRQRLESYQQGGVLR
jgi:Flp pilus assembly protein TadD